jgi:plasmid stability protein
MHRTTIALREDLARRARIKAAAEGVSVSEVVRDLLSRWLSGEVGRGGAPESREATTARALATFGMWKERDPDEFLVRSREGLSRRDRDVEHARVAP